MQSFRMILTILFALAAILYLVATAQAAGPRNPYSSFNLSGINYGAQQWERAQRQGRVVWPYYNVPSRSSGRSWSPTSGVYVGGVVAGGSGAGTIIQGGAYRPTQQSSTTRTGRRWRR